MSKPEEEEIRAWLLEVGISLHPAGNLMDLLESGVVLCELINKYLPGKCSPKDSKIVFRKMENIEMFLSVAREVGVRDPELFQPVDLVYPDRRKPKQVAICLYALSRSLRFRYPAIKYKGIGPKQARENPRAFTEEQMEESRRTISLQMGAIKAEPQLTLDSGRRQITPMQ